MKLIYFLCLIPIAELSLINDIFKNRKINSVINFQCDKKNAFSAQKRFISNNIKIKSMLIDYNTTYNIPFSYKKIGVALNTSCEGWTRVFDNLDLKNVFKITFTWIIITENSALIVNHLKKYPIEIDSTLIIANKDKENFYHLYELFNTGYYTQGVWNLRKLGYWNSALYFEQHYELGRRDLSGVVLKSTVVILGRVVNETFAEYITHSKHLIVDTLNKFKFISLLTYLREMYNYSYILQRTNSWGYPNNGSFDGMVGALQRQEADISGSPVYIRKDRTRVIDYCAVPTFEAKQRFILRHPKHPGGFYKIYTRPLANKTWYCTTVLLILAGGLLVVMVKIKILMGPYDEIDSSWSLALLSIWSAFCQQGMSVSRSATSVKLLIFVTFLFTLTIYQYYVATVVSTLLQEAPKTIRTLDDLVNSDLKAGIEDTLYVKDFLRLTTDPVAIKLYHKKIKTSEGNNFFTPERGLALVKKGGFAFHVDSMIAYRIMRKTFTENELCEAHEVAMYPTQIMYAATKKGSPYREHITYGLRRMTESGLLYRLRLVWDQPRPPCVHTPDTSLISVSLREFSMAIIVLVFGMFLSMAILIGEIFFHRFCTKIEFIEFSN